MLTIDVLSAFVICGAGSLVGAAMTWLARPDEDHTRSALRACTLALATLAAGLLPLVFGVSDPMAGAVLLTLFASVLAVSLFAWGLVRLGNLRVPKRALTLTLPIVPIAFCAALPFGAFTVHLVFVVMMAIASLLAVATQWRALRGPAHLSERVLAWSVLAFALTWVVRLPLLLVTPGPVPVDHMMVPPQLRSLFAILYGVMPIFVATMVLNIVNEGLSRKLQERSRTDELTGLVSRRGLRERAPRTIAHAAAEGHAVALLMIDLDHFKRINDEHGHLTGDDVLRETARRMLHGLRADALITRYGGEEFCAVVPVADLGVARAVAERLRSAIGGVDCSTGTGPVRITASVGLSMLGLNESFEVALRRADEALYRAKASGRNRVEVMFESAA